MSDPTEQLLRAVLAGQERTEIGIGRLMGEVSSVRAALEHHEEKDDARHGEDDKRFRALEGTDAEITGQRKIDIELQRKVAELEAQRRGEREAHEAKLETARAAERAQRTQVLTAVISAVAATAVAATVTAMVAHVVWR